MNRKLVTTLEVVAIVGLIAYVLWLGGLFTPPPAPTPTPTAFTTSTPAPPPTATPPPTPVGTVPPLTQTSGRIAFTSTRDRNAEIYVMEADGSNPQNLTRNPAQDTLIGWSPDGTRLAFFSTRSNGWLEIFVMDANGSNVMQLTHSFGTNTAYSAGVVWSPDGRYLLATRGSPWLVQQYPRATALDLIASDGSGVNELYHNQAYIGQASFSPDGQLVVAILQTDSGTGLYSSSISGTPDFKLTNRNCAYNYIWHPGQNRLTCSTGTSFFDLDSDGTNQKVVLANSNSIDYANYSAWAPNNSKLLTNFVNWLGASDPSS